MVITKLNRIINQQILNKNNQQHKRVQTVVSTWNNLLKIKVEQFDLK